MKQNSKSLRFAALALAFATGPGLRSQTVWTSPAGGQWAGASNWSAGVPNINIVATITNAGTKTILIQSDTPAANLAARRLDLYAPAGSTNSLRLDNLGLAAFQITNSLEMDAGSRLELVSSTLIIRGGANGHFNQLAGDLRLAGGALVTTNGAELRIGRTGIGQANVSDGTMTAQGDFVVGGEPGSDGTLALSNGLVQIGGQLTIGDNLAAIGRVHIAGGTFIATNTTLAARIGDDGEGTMTISSGTVLMDDISVGRSANSVGRLFIRGGTVQSDSLSVGRFAGSQGTLEVTGGTLNLEASSLYIGREGAGATVISNGTVRTANLFLAASSGASGSLRLSGGTIGASQFIATNSAGQIQFGAGRLETKSSTVANGAVFVVGDGVQSATMLLDGGTHTFADGLTISSNATLIGTGAVIGTLIVLPGGNNQLGAPPPVSLTPLAGNGPFRFSFPSEAGKLYDVLSATNLSQPQWQWQSTLSGNGASLTFTNPRPGEQGFFRVLTH